MGMADDPPETGIFLADKFDGDFEPLSIPSLLGVHLYSAARPQPGPKTKTCRSNFRS